MEQAVDFWIPSDDREPIGREGPKARPATAQGNVGQSGSVLQKLIDEKILGLGINRRYFGRTFGLIAGTKKQAMLLRASRSIRRRDPTPVEHHGEGVRRRRRRRTGVDEGVSAGVERTAAKIPGPSACGIDDDASTDFAMRRSDTTHDRSVKDQGFTGAVGDDLKAGVPGLFQQIGQQRMDVNDAIGGAEERVVKLKPAQKRETLPRLGSWQQFGGYAPFVQLLAPFGGSVWLTVNQVQTSGLAEDWTSSNRPSHGAARTPSMVSFRRSGIRLQLARHCGVAAGRVASGQQLPFENQAARHAGSRQRRGN